MTLTTRQSTGRRSMAGDEALYDRLGVGYTATRRTDPRIAGRIWAALGDARSVLNVGAGTGSYEPTDRKVMAVEPSATMLAQRPRDAAPAVQAEAEALPFDDDAFDAVLAVISDHHWRDRARGLSEMRRVARRRVVLFNADPAEAERFWLTRDYLPGFLDLIPESYRRPDAWAEELTLRLGPVRLEPVHVPHDCEDGFYGAFWRRPEAYLSARVRAGISVFARLDPEEVSKAVAQLASDLETGAWERRHGVLLERQSLELGFRLVVADLDEGWTTAIPAPSG